MKSLPEFIRTLVKALRDFQLYGSIHPHWERTLGRLSEDYAEFMGNRAQVQIASRNGRIFVDKVPEDRMNLQIKTLASLLEDRQIHAIMFFAGATDPELQALCALLSLTRAQIMEVGGARKWLLEQEVTRITVLATRLEEVTEAGEVLASLLESMPGLPGPGPSPGAPGDGPPESGRAVTGPAPAAPAVAGSTGPAAPFGSEEDQGTLSEMVARLHGHFRSLSAGVSGPTDLEGLAEFLQSAGLDGDGAQPATFGALSQAVGALDPQERLGLFRGAESLDSEPLRKLFSRLVGTHGVENLVDLYHRGALNHQDLAEAAAELRSLSPNPPQWTNHLLDALRKEGLSATQLEELMEVLGWDGLSSEDRFARLLQGQRVFEVPTAKVLALLRELLEAGRNQDFLLLLNHYATGLAFPSVARRGQVARAFETIAGWVDIPGIPPPLMKELMDILARAYGREKDPDVHQWFSQAVEHLLWFWVQEGSPQRAEGLFADLQDIVTELSLPAPWKEKATEDLLVRLGTAERLDRVLGQLFQLDREAAATQVHPFLRMLGPHAASQLVERLGEEKDRARRGRLLEALKSCGQTAEAALLDSLRSSQWFVVRNALIVLGETSSPERLPDILATLKHPDPRVVRAGVRASGRLGGRQAETALVALLAQTDSATQLEILFVLGEMKAKGAVSALAELGKAKGKLKPAQEKVREKAIEILGTLGSVSAIPALEGLLVRRKGIFSESREPFAIRLLAFRALLALGEPEALKAADQVLTLEPPGEDREAFLAAMYTH